LSVKNEQETLMKVSTKKLFTATAYPSLKEQQTLYKVSNYIHFLSNTAYPSLLVELQILNTFKRAFWAHGRPAIMNSKFMNPVKM